jgi:cyanate lyase
LSGCHFLLPRQSYMRRSVLCLMSDSSRPTFSRQFGDGIMSMIDCHVNIAKKEDPKGDRVVLTFE